MEDLRNGRDSLAGRDSESPSGRAVTGSDTFGLLSWPALVAAIIVLAVAVACLAAALLVTHRPSLGPAATPFAGATARVLVDGGSPRAQLDVWTGEHHTFARGEPVPIHVWSTVDGTVSVYALDPTGERQLLFNTEMEPGDEIQEVWCCPHLDGLWLLKADLNQGQATAEWDLTVEADPNPDSGSFAVIYDFVARAQDATWIFYYAMPITETYQVASSHGENYPMGHVQVLSSATLEGGEPASDVLLTNPPWIAEGIVAGRYNVAHLEIADGDYLFVTVGFLDGSYRGDAFFSLVAQPDTLGAPTPSPVEEARARSRIGGLGPGAMTMISVRDQSDPQPWDPQRIKTFTFPLRTGVPIAFIYLIVDNGSTAYQDRAVWVDAEIRRPID